MATGKCTVPYTEDYYNTTYEFELISWDGGEVDYASTVFWYGDIASVALSPSGMKKHCSLYFPQYLQTI